VTGVVDIRPKRQPSHQDQELKNHKHFFAPYTNKSKNAHKEEKIPFSGHQLGHIKK